MAVLLEAAAEDIKLIDCLGPEDLCLDPSSADGLKPVRYCNATAPQRQSGHRMWFRSVFASVLLRQTVHRTAAVLSALLSNLWISSALSLLAVTWS